MTKGATRVHTRILRSNLVLIFQSKNYRSRSAIIKILSDEWKLISAAAYFSLLTAFGMGFREWDPGRWIRLLPLREYELIPVYWARPLAGVQSLVSLYLLVLFVLSFFGRPFV